MTACQSEFDTNLVPGLASSYRRSPPRSWQQRACGRRPCSRHWRTWVAWTSHRLLSRGCVFAALRGGGSMPVRDREARPAAQVGAARRPPTLRCSLPGSNNGHGPPSRPYHRGRHLDQTPTPSPLPSPRPAPASSPTFCLTRHDRLSATPPPVQAPRTQLPKRTPVAFVARADAEGGGWRGGPTPSSAPLSPGGDGLYNRRRARRSDDVDPPDHGSRRRRRRHNPSEPGDGCWRRGGLKVMGKTAIPAKVDR